MNTSHETTRDICTLPQNDLALIHDIRELLRDRDHNLLSNEMPQYLSDRLSIDPLDASLLADVVGNQYDIFSDETTFRLELQACKTLQQVVIVIRRHLKNEKNWERVDAAV